MLLSTALQLIANSGLLGDMIAAARMSAYLLALGGIGLLITRAVATPDTRPFLTTIFLGSLVLRVISSLFLMRVVPLLVDNHPYLSLGFINDDSTVFDNLATRGLLAIQRGDNPFLAYGTGQTGAVAYVFLMTLTYVMTGHELLAVQFMNSVFGSLVPVFGFLLAQKMVPSGQARLAGIFMALYPEQILYSGSHGKDMSIVFAFLLGLWLISELVNQTTTRGRSWLVVTLVMLSSYLALARFYYAILLGVALVLGFGIGNIRRMSPKQILQGLTLVAVMMALMLVLIELLLPNGIQIFRAPLLAAQGFYDRFTGGSARAGSLYVLFRFPFNIIFFPLVIMGVLFNPFILWPFISPTEVYWLLLPSMIVWYIAIPFVVYGFATMHRPGIRRMVFLVVCGAMLILMVTGSGLTTAGRSKLPLQPYALIYAVVGLRAFQANTRWINWITGIYAAAIIGIITLYLLLKLPIPLNLLIWAFLPNLALVAIIAGVWWRRQQRLPHEDTSEAIQL